MNDLIKRILHQAVVFILIFNIGVFGYMAAPGGTTAVDLAKSGLPVVLRAAEDVITPGEIYELDVSRPIVQALIRLDEQLYSSRVDHLVKVSPGWKAYVITGDLAREISHKTSSYAFTDVLNHRIIFLAVGGMPPMLTISHEFTHVLQAEDSFRIILIPRIVAEYEAEIISRSVVGMLADLGLPNTYPVHGISWIEKLEVRKYLARQGL